MQLRLKEWRDPALFRSHVEGSLCEREAENNLVIGILSGIIDGRQKFTDTPPLLCSVEAETGIQLVALRTPPQNLVLSTAKSEDAVAVLARGLWAAGHHLPGVNARLREADIFAETWREITGARIRRESAQRIYCLDRVSPRRPIAGHLHRCDEPDLALATEWMRAFHHDVGEHRIPADAGRFIGQRDAGLFFWIDDRPVSMTGFSGPTPNGIRIAPVYTPPQLRGRGFAGACVAAVSQSLLDEGRKFCFLYTDLANPTSNHIYQEIGYRPVCDASALVFE
jgi:predicted GNAT family acetyltransferase